VRDVQFPGVSGERQPTVNAHPSGESPRASRACARDTEAPHASRTCAFRRSLARGTRKPYTGLHTYPRIHHNTLHTPHKMLSPTPSTTRRPPHGLDTTLIMALFKSPPCVFNPRRYRHSRIRSVAPPCRRVRRSAPRVGVGRRVARARASPSLHLLLARSLARARPSCRSHPSPARGAAASIRASRGSSSGRRPRRRRRPRRASREVG